MTELLATGAIEVGKLAGSELYGLFAAAHWQVEQTHRAPSANGIRLYVR